MGELVDRVDEQDQVLAVVDRAEAIRRGWIGLHEVDTPETATAPRNRRPVIPVRSALRTMRP